MTNPSVTPTHRSQLLDRLPKQGVGAEIGVWKGDFSAQILAYNDPAQLHLIDPWLYQPEFSNRMYGGSVAKSQEDMDAIYDSVVSRFDGDDRVSFDRGKSDKVLSAFPNAYFDWVYIDGNHYYEYVLQDLKISLHKVKSGGFITGDDYTWGEIDGFPVERAVSDFVSQQGLQDHLTIFHSQYLIELK